MTDGLMDINLSKKYCFEALPGWMSGSEIRSLVGSANFAISLIKDSKRLFSIIIINSDIFIRPSVD